MDTSAVNVASEPRRSGRLTIIVAGMIAAFLSGLAAIAFLLRWLQNHPLDIFVWYRIVLAALIIALLVTGRV